MSCSATSALNTSYCAKMCIRDRCVDKSGTPLADSIIWADMRAQDAERFIIERVGAREFFHIAGHRPGASYALAKFMWLREEHPDRCV